VRRCSRSRNATRSSRRSPGQSVLLPEQDAEGSAICSSRSVPGRACRYGTPRAIRCRS
jgi:hypothetical protein